MSMSDGIEYPVTVGIRTNEGAPYTCITDANGKQIRWVDVCAALNAAESYRRALIKYGAHLEFACTFGTLEKKAECVCGLDEIKKAALEGEG